MSPFKRIGPIASTGSRIDESLGVWWFPGFSIGTGNDEEDDFPGER